MNHRLDSPAALWLRRARRILSGAAFGLALAGCGSGDDGDSPPPPRQVQFHAAEMVKAAPVLTADATDGRCPDSKAPCFKNNHDFTNGQRRMLRIEDIGLAALSHDSDDTADRFLGGIATTSASAVAAVKGSSLAGDLPTGSGSPPAAIGARLFDGATDSLVSALARKAGLSVAIDLADGGVIDAPSGGAVPQDNTVSPRLWATSADFDGDGFEDVVFATLSSSPQLQVMYVKDPTGSKSADNIQFGPSIVVNPMLAVATGNFLGTGNMVVIAVAQSDGKLLLQYYAVDPTSRQLSLQQSLTLNRLAGALQATGVSTAVGRFNAAAFGPIGHDQMLIAASDGLRTDLLSVDAASASGTATLAPVQRLQGISDGQLLMRPVLRAGRFDWSSPFDSAVLLLTDQGNVGAPTQNRVFTVLTLDANLDVGRQTQDYAISTNQCIYDMQVGNFDRRKPDPTPNAPPGSTLHDPNLQILFLSSSATNSDDADDRSCSGGDSGNASKGMTLSTYDVNIATDGALSLGSFGSYVWSSFTEARLREASLAVPDLQGRSMVLGAPTILTVEQARQLTASIAAPPMHADFIGGKLANLTVAPDGFSAQFSWSNSSDNKITGTDTSSYTNAYQESEEAKIGFGSNCADSTKPGGCVSVDEKASFSQQLSNSTTTLNGTYSAWNLTVQSAPALDDLVAYSDSTVTFYFYPVLGKTVCPASTPDCAPQDRKPATVVFSGPDTVTRFIVDASLAPWYQPPWMPGNALSYPGTLEQLKLAAYPNDPSSYQALSNGNQTWATDATFGTQNNTWASTSTAGSTVSSGHNYQYEAGVSVSGSYNFAFGTGSVSAGFDYTRSDSLQNVVDSVTNLSQSSGVLFTKEAQFADPGTYAYLVTPSVFGQITPPTAPAAFADTADLTSFGALRVGYVVDLLGSGGGGTGSFWTSDRATYRAAPDIAFNQPRRWTTKTLTADRGDGTCLLPNRSGTNFDCVELTPPPQEPGPFSDERHYMRGFFITGPTAGGPQLSSANAGDPLVLQARVHNFSFAAMPAGVTLKVRFYAMPWDIATAQPAGASLIVGTAATQLAVPPYSNTGAPNWTLVSQAFDTTNLANRDFVFWAVTWMEDAQGGLVAELTGKGLNSIPGTNLDFAGVAALEQAYGNNLGLYHQVFHVFDKQGPAAVGAQAVTATATGPTIVITEVGSHATTVQRGDSLLLGARVRTAAAHPPRGGLTVHFVDGDPAQGGMVIGIEHLPYLKGGSVHELHANVRPRQCGERTLYVVAGPGTRFEHVARLGKINVSCS